MVAIESALAATSIAFGANYLLPIPFKEYGIWSLRRRCRLTRALVLTYDDGPSELTADVLTLLAEHKARATFFVPSERADEHPETLARIRALGHEIGAHSNEHRHAWRCWPWVAHRDAVAGWAKLHRPPIAPVLYRPAFGKITATTWRALRRAGAPLAWWTIDSGDSFSTPPQGRAESALERAKGGVVLLHDSDRGREHAAFVLSTTRALLELARTEKMSVLPMGELLGVTKQGVLL